MASPFDSETLEYMVLVNHEGQYSLWPGFRDPPAGWEIVGPKGKRRVCLDWIEQQWADMRPKSLAGQLQRSDARE